MNPAGFELRGPVTPTGRLVRDAFAARELLVMLARKDFFSRYRRASFGLLWAVALPLIQAGILAVVFSNVVKIETEFFYPVFILTGTVAWGFFSQTLNAASTAIVDASSMTTKVYFPRSVVPLASVLANAPGLVMNLVILVAMALLTGMPLSSRLLLLPVALTATALLTAFMSLVASALHVYFRDLRYVLQAAMLAWFYVTPIFYPLGDVGGMMRPFVLANPVTGVVELVRAATIGAEEGTGIALVALTAWLLVLGVVSIGLYRRYDRVFADLL